MLLAEKAARKDIQAAVDDTVDHVVAERARSHQRDRRLAILGAILVAAHGLQTKLQDAIARSRYLARSTAVRRLGAELSAGGLSVGAHTLSLTAQGSALDAAHAESAAASIASRWRAAAIAASKRTADAETPYRSIDRTRTIVRPSIDLTARNEIVEAYNGEHAAAYSEALLRDEALATEVARLGLARIWDATLDKRTCDQCESLDGRILDDDDPEPPIHPGCRCIVTIVPIH